MSLPTGTRLGPYEIVALLGAGGMGQVYRARDTRLNRTVAIKSLQPTVASDPERIARFEREAQLLASLNHPHIAAIHGLQEAGNATYLVLEFVDGRPLDAAIREAAIPGSPERGLPLEDALRIARQIADAIAAAHERGIIHRDLKPANVMITAGGQAKVLDFGLGKALAGDSGGPVSQANSPTITLGGTQAGIILGTAGYMSPEQARGHAADRRSDVWSFGCVLFEMLAGSRAFDGEDVTDTIAAIVRGEPNWSALPTTTAPALRRLIERCLVKDRTQRLADMSVVRYVLDEAVADSRQPAVPPDLEPRSPPNTASRRRSITLWRTAALLSSAAAIALAIAYAWRSDATSPQAVRFGIPPPTDIRQMSNGVGDNHGGAISPDGRSIVFSGVHTRTGQVGIFVRRLDEASASMILGTDGGLYPFWSPDSRAIAFYAHGKLRRINIDGSGLQDICNAATGGWGGSWNSDNIIVAGLEDPGPLLMVSAHGGEPKPVTSLQKSEGDHDWPHFLPDGRHFVFTAWSDVEDGGNGYIGSLDSPDRTLAAKNMTGTAAWADPGYVLFSRHGSLFAQTIDPGRLVPEGEPVAVTTEVRAPIVASRTGAISFYTRPGVQTSRLIWIAADGTNEQPLTDPGYYLDAAISPEGSRLAYARTDTAGGAHDVWIRDLATGAERRLTFHPGHDHSPVWSPDGTELLFSSLRQNVVGLYKKSASGTGDETLVSATTSFQQYPTQWHVNGTITYYAGSPAWDLWAFTAPSGAATRLLPTPAAFDGRARAAISPDGKWLAFDTRATSRFEVYLTTFPPSASKWMVTTEGGAEPKWSRDGRRLFYVSSLTNGLMAVEVTIGAGGAPAFGPPRRIYSGPIGWGWSTSRSFDIEPRSGRFLVNVPVATGELMVLLNWQELLKNEK